MHQPCPNVLYLGCGGAWVTVVCWPQNFLRLQRPGHLAWDKVPLVQGHDWTHPGPHSKLSLPSASWCTPAYPTTLLSPTLLSTSLSLVSQHMSPHAPQITLSTSKLHAPHCPPHLLCHNIPLHPTASPQCPGAPCYIQCKAVPYYMAVQSILL